MTPLQQKEIRGKVPLREVTGVRGRDPLPWGLPPGARLGEGPLDWTAGCPLLPGFSAQKASRLGQLQGPSYKEKGRRRFQGLAIPEPSNPDPLEHTVPPGVLGQSRGRSLSHLQAGARFPKCPFLPTIPETGTWGGGGAYLALLGRMATCGFWRGWQVAADR